MSYPGGKAGGNTPHRIINQMPPHSQYVEAFLGAGAIMRAKRPAACSIGIDSDSHVLQSRWRGDEVPSLTLVCDDAVKWLAYHATPHRSIQDGLTLVETHLGPGTLIYLDPPYLLETRRSQRDLYRHEFHTPEEHAVLLEVITGLDCLVMISGYWSQLYADTLKDWRAISWRAMTRNGPATEWLWMNFDEPTELHDYRRLGNNFREREKYKRQQARWRARLAKMPALQRWAMFSVIEELKR